MGGVNRSINLKNPSRSGFLKALVGKLGDNRYVIEVAFLFLGKQLGWQRGAKAPSLSGIGVFLFFLKRRFLLC